MRDAPQLLTQVLHRAGWRTGVEVAVKRGARGQAAIDEAGRDRTSLANAEPSPRVNGRLHLSALRDAFGRHVAADTVGASGRSESVIAA